MVTKPCGRTGIDAAIAMEVSQLLAMTLRLRSGRRICAANGTDRFFGFCFGSREGLTAAEGYQHRAGPPHAQPCSRKCRVDHKGLLVMYPNWGSRRHSPAPTCVDSSCHVALATTYRDIAIDKASIKPPTAKEVGVIGWLRSLASTLNKLHAISWVTQSA